MILIIITTTINIIISIVISIITIISIRFQSKDVVCISR
jgi:hypothetical protein